MHRKRVVCFQLEKEVNQLVKLAMILKLNLTIVPLFMKVHLIYNQEWYWVAKVSLTLYCMFNNRKIQEKDQEALFDRQRGLQYFRKAEFGQLTKVGLSFMTPSTNQRNRFGLMQQQSRPVLQ